MASGLLRQNPQSGVPDEPPVVGLASEVVAEPEKSPLIPLTIVWLADERPWGRRHGWQLEPIGQGLAINRRRLRR